MPQPERKLAIQAGPAAGTNRHEELPRLKWRAPPDPLASRWRMSNDAVKTYALSTIPACQLCRDASIRPRTN
jgi:hypothetical protein